MNSDEIVQELQQFQKEITGFFGQLTARRRAKTKAKLTESAHPPKPRADSRETISPKNVSRSPSIDKSPSGFPRQDSTARKATSQNPSVASFNAKDDSPDRTSRSPLRDSKANSRPVSPRPNPVNSRAEDLNQPRFTSINISESMLPLSEYNITQDNALVGLYLNHNETEFFVSTGNKLVNMSIREPNRVVFKTKITLTAHDVG